MTHKIGFCRRPAPGGDAFNGDAWRAEVLLLDEHTAALDPKTARTVLSITDEIVSQNKLTTIMVTHNMRDALRYGDESDAR